MGEGATGKLGANSVLQNHSNRDAGSEGTQPEVRDLCSQPGCWGAGVLWSATYIGSARPLPSLGLCCLISEVGRVAPAYCEVLSHSISVFRTFYICMSLSEGQRGASQNTRNNNQREQCCMLLCVMVSMNLWLGGCEWHFWPVASLSRQHCCAGTTVQGPFSPSAMDCPLILRGPFFYLVLLT